MALSRIHGEEELYVGSVFALRRPTILEQFKITHILSVIPYSLDKSDDLGGKFTHLSIDIDDVEDADLLAHLARCVRFIDSALHPDHQEHGNGEAADGSATHPEDSEDGDAAASAPRESLSENVTAAQLAKLSLKPASEKRPSEAQPAGSVFVHCAMGKSRSVSVVIAYLLWKYPHRFGASDARNPDRSIVAGNAVTRALQWVRDARGIAEPNPGFMKQLEMWWEMGCPAGSDDAMEKQVTYQRWLYKREVDESARIGRPPEWLRFEDEAEGEGDRTSGGIVSGGRTQEEPATAELRCKKCRRVLATRPFIVPHRPMVDGRGRCPHYFVEPLSWMRPILEEGALEGRLICPNTKCASSLGRYSWQGFKCSCRDWVCPAFSLQQSKVDEIAARPDAESGQGLDPRAALGIRLPPSGGAPKESL